MLRVLPITCLGMFGMGTGIWITNESHGNSESFGKWFSAISLFIYMLGFSIGMGPTPWLIL